MGVFDYFTSAFKARGNNMSKTGAGTWYGFYSYYNYMGLEMRNNIITANSGITGSVYGFNLNYLYSNSNPANQVLTTYGAITGNTVNLNTTNTGTGSGSAYVMYHQYCNADSISNNSFTATTYTGSIYEIYNYGSSYYTPSSPNTYPGGYNTITGNTWDCRSLSSGGHTDYFGYYQYKMVYSNNNRKIQSFGGGSITDYGYYCDSLTFMNNTIFDSTTSGSITAYHGMYGNPNVSYSYYGNFQNNNIRLVSNSASVTHYFAYYTQNNTCNNNNMYVWAGTYAYNYLTYYNQNGSITNNTAYVWANTSYAYSGLGYYNLNGNCSNNNLTVRCKDSYMYMYNAYMGGAFTNNTINATADGSGYIYNYNGYNTLSGAGNILIDHNIYNLNCPATGYIAYGSYAYSYNYSNMIMTNNIFNMNCANTSTTNYGLYWYYPSGTVKNNVFNMNLNNSSGGGTCAYLMYGLAGNTTDFINNTFNLNGSTSTAVATIYDYLYSAGTTNFRNNIFSRTGGTTGCAFLSYDLTGNYTKGDYNLYYGGASPTGIQSGTSLGGGTNVNTMQAWRTATGQDKNSLTYNPGYMSPATGDLRPDPTNSSSWSVQGRGVQIPGNSTDILGNARAVTTSAGVPDLGAYEFTPTATAPFCTATPAAAVAGADQVFTFGMDTVAVISWASTSAVPASGQIFCKQYTGIQPVSGFLAFNPTSTMFFDSIDVNTAGAYNYSIKNYFKDPWLGTIATKSVLHLAKKDVANAGAWTGYPYTVSTVNITRNFINTIPTPTGFSNFGYFTGMDIANNAGVSQTVESPTGTFCPGTYTVKIRVLNNGNNVINNLKIDWTLNLVPQTQITWTTPIGINTGVPGSNVAIVTLGNIAFGSGAVNIKAWTSVPNGFTDPVAGDDTAYLALHAALAGTYYIDASNTPPTDWTTVTQAVADLYTYGVCGPVTFRVRAGSYSGKADFNGTAPGMSATNRVTMMSDNGVASSANITFNSTTSSDWTMRMNNASYFSFKNLTITASNASYGYALYMLGNSNKDSLIGCNFTCGGNSSSYSVPIYAYGLNAPTGDVFMNNTLNLGYYGFYWYPGTSNTSAGQDLVFTGNTLNNFQYGNFFYYTANQKINNNTFIGTSSAYYAIYLYNYYAYGSTYSAFQCNNNKVRGMSSSGYPLYIQYPNGYSGLSGTPPTRSQILNNDVAVAGSYYGLISLYYPINTDFWNNSVNIGSIGYYGAYVYAYTAPYVGLDMRNNAIKMGSGGTYAAYMYLSSGNNVCDFNDWDNGSTGTWQTYYSSYANFAAYKAGNAAYNFEKNSFTYPIGYISGTCQPDPNNPNSWALNGRGVQIVGNATDMNGNPRVTIRQNGVPDIGAYEFEPTVAPPNCTAVPTTATPGAWQHFLFGVDTVASIFWRPDLLYTSPLNVKQYSGRVGTSTSPITGISPNRYMYFYTDITPTNPGSTYHFDANIYYKDIWLGKIQNEPGLMMAQKTSLYPWQIYSNGSSGVVVARKMVSVFDVTSFGAFTGIDTVATFSAFIHFGGSPIMCTGDSVTLYANTGNSYTYQWYKDNQPIGGATNSSYVVKVGGDYKVEVTAPGPPVYVAMSTPVSISIVPPPMALIQASGALTYCSGSSLSLNTSPGASTYQWKLNGVNVGTNSQSYTVGAAGSYTVTVRNIGCSVTSPATVVSPGPLSISLGPDVRGCEIKNQPYTIDAGHPGAKYTWYLNGNPTGDTTQKINVFKGTGDYTVIVDAGPGCLAKDTVNMQIDPLPSVVGISYVKAGSSYTFSQLVYRMQPATCGYSMTTVL